MADANYVGGMRGFGVQRNVRGLEFIQRAKRLYDAIVGGRCVEVKEGLRRRKVPLVIPRVSAFQAVRHPSCSVTRQNDVARSSSGGGLVSKARDTVREAPVLQER